MLILRPYDKSMFILCCNETCTTASRNFDRVFISFFLRKGDFIREVNSQGLYQASLDETYNILGNLQPGNVTFKIRRKKSSPKWSRRSSKEREVKAASVAGDGNLSKWGNILDLRTSSPVPENLADLMTPARHLSGNCPLQK